MFYILKYIFSLFLKKKNIKIVKIILNKNVRIYICYLCFFLISCQKNSDLNPNINSRKAISLDNNISNNSFEDNSSYFNIEDNNFQNFKTNTEKDKKPDNIFFNEKKTPSKLFHLLDILEKNQNIENSNYLGHHKNTRKNMIYGVKDSKVFDENKNYKPHYNQSEAGGYKLIPLLIGLIITVVITIIGIIVINILFNPMFGLLF